MDEEKTKSDYPCDYPNARDCEHGQLRRTCSHCEDAAHISTLEAQLREREEECKGLREAESDELAGIAARLDGAPRDATKSECWLIGWDGQDADLALLARAESAEQALAAARDRIKLFENLLTTMPSYGELVDAAGLAIISQDELAALKSRSDDAGRIKRAATVIADRIGFSPDNVYDVACEALAAADSKGE